MTYLALHFVCGLIAFGISISQRKTEEINYSELLYAVVLGPIGLGYLIKK